MGLIQISNELILSNIKPSAKVESHNKNVRNIHLASIGLGSVLWLSAFTDLLQHTFLFHVQICTLRMELVVHVDFVPREAKEECAKKKHLVASVFFIDLKSPRRERSPSQFTICLEMKYHCGNLYLS